MNHTTKEDTYEQLDKTDHNMSNLVELMNTLVEIDRKESARKRRLESETKGFLVNEDTYLCSLCGYWITDGMWYDKWGMKCLQCQSALNRKIVPGYIFKDYSNEKHTTSPRLFGLYGIHHQTLRKLTRRGELKAREMPHGILVFLKQENPDLVGIIEEEMKAKQ